MPVGTGAVTLQTIPADPFVIDPQAFFQMTSREVFTPFVLADPGPGGFITRQLMQAGIVSKVRLSFVGSLVVASAAVTTGDKWPHGILGGLTLSANGQNELWNVNGEDLHALRFLRYPAYTEKVDTFPGTVGGGDSVAVGTYPIHLTFEVPIAIDDTSLIGALYTQSNASNFTLRITRSANADIFSALPANATITGNWYVEETIFDIPFDPNGRMVIPDLTRLHGVNAIDTAFTNVGDVRTELIRANGQLARLLMSVRASATNRLSAQPNAAASKKIDRLRVEYGGNKKPYDFNPAATLLALNNQHYGATVPYDRLVLDLIKENPPRDIFLLEGITELAVVPQVNAAVTVTAGAVRVVQETLF